MEYFRIQKAAKEVLSGVLNVKKNDCSSSTTKVFFICPTEQNIGVTALNGRWLHSCVQAAQVSSNIREEGACY